MTALREYVRRKKLDPYVIFTGFLPENDIINLYHASHLGLYPFKEQGGLLAPFENLCAGKPIIISPTNGAAEPIRRYKLGIVTNNYANAIIDVYNNYGLYKNMAQRAKKIIEQEFSWEKYCERLLRIFENAYYSRVRDTRAIVVDNVLRKNMPADFHG
jgi:glycosyltransferase involved in cell wall biosynthesis